MSRSYHITNKAAAKKFNQGDRSAVVEYSEKRDVKKKITEYRPIYNEIHPTAKGDKLRNSTVVRAVRSVKKTTTDAFEEKA